MKVDTEPWFDDVDIANTDPFWTESMKQHVSDKLLAAMRRFYSHLPRKKQASLKIEGRNYASEWAPVGHLFRSDRRPDLVAKATFRFRLGNSCLRLTSDQTRVLYQTSTKAIREFTTNPQVFVSQVLFISAKGLARTSSTYDLHARVIFQ